MAKLKVTFKCEGDDIGLISHVLSEHGVATIAVSSLRDFEPKHKSFVPDTPMVDCQGEKTVEKPFKSREIARGAQTTPPSTWPSGKKLMGYLKTTPSARCPELEEFMVKQGYARNSCASILHGLVKEGMVYRVSRGVYRAS